MSLERVNTWVGIGSGVLGCLSGLVALLRILPAERRRCLFRWLAGGAVVLGVAVQATPLVCLALSRDGSLLLSGHWDDSLSLHDLTGGGLSEQLRGSPASPLSAAAFGPDAVVTAGGESLCVWDLSTRRPRF